MGLDGDLHSKCVSSWLILREVSQSCWEMQEIYVKTATIPPPHHKPTPRPRSGSRVSASVFSPS